MKFIIAKGIEGGENAINLEHVSRAFYRRGGGGEPSRLNIDIGGTENDVLLVGEEAERVWELIRGEAGGG